MHVRRMFIVAIALFAFVGLANQLQAVVVEKTLLSDGFDTGASPTVGDDGDDPLDAEWSNHGSAITITRVDDSGGIGTGFALNANNGGSTFRGIQGLLPDAASLLIGESIEIRLDLRLTEGPDNNSGGMRVGLFELQDAVADTAGYHVQIGTGGSGTLAAVQDRGGGGSGGGGSDTAFLSGGSTGAAFGSINDLNAHNVAVTITRTGATTTSVATVVDGVSRLGNDTDGSIIERFEAAVIRQGSVNDDFRIDNINVVHTQLNRLTLTGDAADMEVQQLINGDTTPLANSSNMLVGHGGGSGGQGREALLMFQLPDANKLAQGFAASLEFQLVQKDGTLPFDADLYGLGFTTDSSDLTDFDDYFHSGIAPGSASLIQTSIMDVDTSLGRIETTGNGDGALSAFIASLYANGAIGGDFAVLSLNPSRDPFASPSGTFDRYHVASGSQSGAPTLILEMSVPEPTTALLGLIAFGTMATRRRRIA